MVMGDAASGARRHDGADRRRWWRSTRRRVPRRRVRVHVESSSICTSRTTAAGVPSNHAHADELIALAETVGRHGRGCDRVHPALVPHRLRRRRPRADPVDGAAPPAAARSTSTRSLRCIRSAPDGWQRSLEFAGRVGRRRAHGAPDVRGQPPGRALRARQHVPLRRSAELPAHARAPRGRARGTRLRDPAVRDAMRADIAARRATRSCSSGR